MCLPPYFSFEFDEQDCGIGNLGWELRGFCEWTGCIKGLNDVVLNEFYMVVYCDSGVEVG